VGEVEADGLAEGTRAGLYEVCEGRRWPNCSKEAASASSSCGLLALAVCGRLVAAGRGRWEGDSPVEAGDRLGSRGRGDAGVAADGEASPGGWAILILDLLLLCWCLGALLETGLDSESGSGAGFLRPNIMDLGRSITG
jgi:hypothetical protein